MSENEQCNSLRLIQSFLCIASTCVTLYNFQYDTIYNIMVYTVMVVISGSYSLITIIDITSNCFLDMSIPPKLWTMYAFSGCLLFFACPTTYFFLIKWKSNSNDNKCFVTCMVISYFLSSSVFLWDGFFIVFFSRKCKPLSRVTPDSESPRLEKDKGRPLNRTLRSQGGQGDSCHHENELTRSRNDLNLAFRHQAPRSPSIQYSQITNRINRKSFNKNLLPVTYGGTFHVSKDAVPLPSPVLRTTEELVRDSDSHSSLTHRDFNEFKIFEVRNN